jgi:hypothetical protein
MMKISLDVDDAFGSTGCDFFEADKSSGSVGIALDRSGE